MFDKDDMRLWANFDQCKMQWTRTGTAVSAETLCLQLVVDKVEESPGQRFVCARSQSGRLEVSCCVQALGDQ